MSDLLLMLVFLPMAAGPFGFWMGLRQGAGYLCTGGSGAGDHDGGLPVDQPGAGERN